MSILVSVLTSLAKSLLRTAASRAGAAMAFFVPSVFSYKDPAI